MAGKYERVCLLGIGSFGKAWLVHDSNKTKNVLKEIQLSTLSDKELDQSLVEVTVLAKCSHVNIVKYVEAFVENRCLQIVMEYADGGDLQKKILEQRGLHFGKEIVGDWFVQITFALKYLHGKNILHRDLKPQNVFITCKNIIKLGDFGISRILLHSEDRAMTTIGTPYYLSPEICHKQPYNHKSDMWALGCILYELCCLKVPFDAPNLTTLMLKIVDGTYLPIPAHYGPLIEDLVEVLLNPIAEKRPTSSQVLSVPKLHPLVDNYNKCHPGNKSYTPSSCLQHTPTNSPKITPPICNLQNIPTNSPKTTPPTSSQKDTPTKCLQKMPTFNDKNSPSFRKRRQSIKKFKEGSHIVGESVNLHCPVWEDAEKDGISPVVVKARPRSGSIVKVKVTGRRASVPCLMKYFEKPNQRSPVRILNGKVVKRMDKESDSVFSKDNKENIVGATYRVKGSTPYNNSDIRRQVAKQIQSCQLPQRSDRGPGFENLPIPQIQLFKELLAGHRRHLAVISNNSSIGSMDDDIFSSTPSIPEEEEEPPRRRKVSCASLTYRLHKLRMDDAPKFKSLIDTQSVKQVQTIYESVITNHNSTRQAVVSLTSFLQAELGAQSFQQLYSLVLESTRSATEFTSVKQQAGDKIVYLPTVIQLLQMEGLLNN